ncbi:hypothetical protein LTR04_001510 [Oleoguttula sp. CCFEE 6159]|nr:hypothetical protein LTR04_001510 [Oleoguttula sp. CCFEE 6159]
MDSSEPGGFVHPGLSSPPPSSIASSSANGALPRPRGTPLKSGSSKESSFIRYVDQGILHIQRRYAKRDSNEHWGDMKGYENFKEAGKDVERLVDIVWVSGTPSLQIPYLLSLALLIQTIIPGFPPSPRAMFGILSKLDHAFVSLLQGRDVDTGEPLPGFDRGRHVSDTEKVRIKSLVERTRVCVVEVMKEGEFDPADAEEPLDSADESMDDSEAYDGLAEVGSWDMEIAKVYDRTIVELGDTLGGESIGIVTE